MSPLFVIGVVAYLAANGNVDDIQFGKFSSVGECNAQSQAAIIKFKESNPEVKDDATPLLCWDTRDQHKAVPKVERKPGSVDL